MGGSQSTPPKSSKSPQRPSTTQSKPSTTTRQQTTSPKKKIISQIPDFSFIHNKYQEIKYHQKKTELDSIDISPDDLFLIATLLPQFCDSPHDMIRTAIRFSTNRAERSNPDNFSQFECNQNMNYCRKVAINRCKVRRKIRSTPTINLPTLPSKDHYNEISIDNIISFLKGNWVHQNEQLLQQMNSLLINLCKGAMTTPDIQSKERFHQIISGILGNDLCEMLLPQEDFDLEKIHQQNIDNLKKIEESQNGISLSFDLTSPASTIKIDSNIVLRQGMCSDGTFLFLLTKTKNLIVYPIYKGLIIDESVANYLFSSFDIDDNSIIFCSQKHLYIKTKTKVYQILISDITKSSITYNQINNERFQNIDNACSDGISYIINYKDHSQLIIKEDKEQRLYNGLPDIHFENGIIFLTNGKYQCLAGLNTNTFFIISYDWSEINKFNLFFEKINEPIESATINSIHDVIFVATKNENDTIISSYLMYNSKNILCNIENINLIQTDNIYERFGNLLYKFMIKLSFSNIIPEKLYVKNDNFMNELKSLIKFIEIFQKNNDLFRALLLLFDLNLRKYQNETIAQSIKPILLNQLIDNKNNQLTKNIIYGVIFNNIDLFYNDENLTNEFLDLIKNMINNNNKGENINNIFIDWALKCLWKSKFITKLTINTEIFIDLFGNKWPKKSCLNNEYSSLIDFLLIYQESLIDASTEIIENDPLNFKNSKIIDNLCNYIKILLCEFREYLFELIKTEHDINQRKINSNSIIYMLISNFMALASPIISSSKIATRIIDDTNEIIKFLNDCFIMSEETNTFLQYFDMIYTYAIACLIRGGSIYQCELDYSWLIRTNFKKNIIINDNVNEDNFNEYIQDQSIRDFIMNENNPTIQFLERKNMKLKTKATKWINKILIVTVCHQTNLLELFIEESSNNNYIPEMKDIINNWVTTLSSKYIYYKRNDIKKSQQFLTNLIILLQLNPSYNNFISNPTFQSEYLQNLKTFILNNDPFLFEQVLNALPERIENILKSFNNLNILCLDIQNKFFQRIIIDGISRTESFQRLGYLLSLTHLDENNLDILKTFTNTLMEMILNYGQLSCLEVLFTILGSCKSLHEFAIDVMNKLTPLIQTNKDPIFYTVAGLANETKTIPDEIFKPDYYDFNNLIMLSACKNGICNNCTYEIIFHYILQDENWIRKIPNVKLFFKLIKNYNNYEKASEYLTCAFGCMHKCLTISNINNLNSFAQIIYGFRDLLNQDTEISTCVKTILESITIESKITKILLLFAIISADLTEYDSIFIFRNEDGNWLNIKTSMLDKSCLLIPITPTNKFIKFNKEKYFEPIQEIELNINKSIDYESILSFWDRCIKNENPLLYKFYIQTLIKYITELNINIEIDEISKSSKPYINYNNLYLRQIDLKRKFDQSEYLTHEYNNIFGRIDQNNWTHLYLYNIMKFQHLFMHIFWIDDGFIIIKDKNNIYLEIKSGLHEIIYNNNEIIHFKGEIYINTYNEIGLIQINEIPFYVNNNATIEFVIKSPQNFILQENNFPENIGNISLRLNEVQQNIIRYNNKINCIEDTNAKEDNYTFDIQTPRLKNNINEKINREGYNEFYCSSSDSIQVDKTQQFLSSKLTIDYLQINNDINMSNQLKNILIAQVIIKNDKALNDITLLSFIRSAVISLIGSENQKFVSDKFPYNLEIGFFQNCSNGLLQSKNIQSIFLATKILLKSNKFLDILGKDLINMAGDIKYHNLLYKKDLIYIAKDINYEPKDKDFIIKFADGSKGKIIMDDSGKWMINTPMIFLFLLWIFIENCNTSEQRICAKLSLINCWIIESPMIKKYLPEFMTYLQRKLEFYPSDFNQIYINHLTYLISTTRNEQLIGFYESEKNYLSLKLNQNINNNYINIDEMKNKMNPSLLNHILQLMKNYNKLDTFPYWDLLPIYESILKTTKYKLYREDCPYIINENYIEINNPSNESLLYIFYFPNITNLNVKVSDDKEQLNKGIILPFEKHENKNVIQYILESKQVKYIYTNQNKINELKVKIEIIRILKYKEEINDQKFQSCIQKFAIDWTDKDTNELLTLSSDYDINKEDFNWLKIKTLQMKSLIRKFGIITLQCKIACLYLINSTINLLNESSLEHFHLGDDEMRRLAIENSNLLQYRSRLFLFNITTNYNPINILQFLINPIILDLERAKDFLNGNSNDLKDSMIYQLSKYTKMFKERFVLPVWGVKYKGSEAVDVSGVTNQTITLSTESFTNIKSELCIIAPNYNGLIDENKPEIIPYPTKSTKEIEEIFYTFGILLGSIIRSSMPQEILFPNFIWKFLSGKSISMNDIYENDVNLKNEILQIKNGQIKDHLWNYKDWDNSIKFINGFPNDKPITIESVDIYEKIVISLRIKSIEKWLLLIRNGFWYNQNIKETAFLSDGLLKFLCCFTTIDIQGVVDHLQFEGGNPQLIGFLESILMNFSEDEMKKFLFFTTAMPSHPNFNFANDYRIRVVFNDNPIIYLPAVHTCSKTIEMPEYPNLKMMKDKLILAMSQGAGMEIA